MSRGAALQSTSQGFEGGADRSLGRFLPAAVTLALLVQLMGVLPLPAFSTPVDDSSPAAMTAAQANSGDHDLPSLFEANEGQFADGVRFGMQSGGFTVLLRDSSATLELEGQDVTLDLARAAPTTHVVGADPLTTKINYLVGPRSEWATNVSTYGAARYVGVYPGIAALFHAQADGFQYDFELAPGADPTQIGMRVGGAEALSIARSGELVVTTEHGTLRQSKPFAYQVIDGEVVEVPSAFKLDGDVVGFKLGNYDASLPLVIDPEVVYSTYLGGDQEERINGFEVDELGNAYIYGNTDSSDVEDVGATTDCDESEEPVSTTAGAYQEDPPDTSSDDTSGDCEETDTGDDDENLFVAKFAPNGDPVYVTYLGGSSNDESPGLPIRDLLGVDATGRAVVAGTTNSFDFPTQTAYDDECSDCGAPTSGSNDGDAFVTMFNEDGSDLVYSTFMGGAQEDGAFAVDVDSDGNAFVAGETFSTDFPTANAQQPVYAGGDSDVWVARFAPSGDPDWATYLGGSVGDGEGDEIPTDISTDDNGNAFVVGKTTSTNFPTETAYDPTPQPDGLSTAFLTSYDPDGDFNYSTYLSGGTCSGTSDTSDCGDKANQVEADSNGTAYVAGSTLSSSFPTTNNAFQDDCGSEAGMENSPDAFLGSFDLSGSDNYVTCFGGAAREELDGLAIDDDDGAYITGWTNSNPTSNAFPLENAYDDDPSWDTENNEMTPEAYVAGFSGNNGSLAFSTYLGGTGPEFGHGIDVSDDGAVYATGLTIQEVSAENEGGNVNCCWTGTHGTTTAEAANFPTTDDSLPPGDEGDAYVAGFEPNGDVIFSTYVGGDGPQEGYYIGTHGDDVVVAGQAGPPAPNLSGQPVTNENWRNANDEPQDADAPSFPLENAYDDDLQETDAQNDDSGDRHNDEAFVTRLSHPFTPSSGGGGGSQTDPDLDVSPEREENELPEEDDHSLSAEISGGDDPIDFKIIAGPNDNSTSAPDFTCTPNDGGECEVGYTSGGEVGLDHICGWIDSDNDNEYEVNGDEEDGGDCEEEHVDEEEEGDETDVVMKNWVGTPAPKPACSDMEDNDRDGLVDAADPGCTGDDDQSEGTDNPNVPACDDGRDNDNDGRTDQGDPDCRGPNDDSERPRNVPESCQIDKFASFNVVLGTGGGETLRGTRGKDLICARGGDDRVFGLGGADVIFLGDGRDQAFAGRGADLVRGDEGRDDIEGNRGGDEVHGGGQGDRAHGNQGNDSLFGHNGNDRLRGGPQDDDLHGGPGRRDSCKGGGGTDTDEGCEV